MKPYHSIPIQDCGEPLVAIPLQRFGRVVPHRYQALGAPYGDKDPFFLREGVLLRLLQAQQNLELIQPQWRIQIFDAFRPIAVQQFMVDYSVQALIQSQNLDVATLTSAEIQTYREQVNQFWAPPSHNPATPPPHSTGAAIDITLLDATGKPVNMGSAVDEISARSFPDHYQSAVEPQEQEYHRRRQLLFEAMQQAGFHRHPNEWWHFSWGDQLWAWLEREQSNPLAIAKYGRVEI